jgi:oleate hydratase
MSERRRAYLVGGGIASLAAATYLVRDAGMDGDRITVYEALPVNGGSLDGRGNPRDGYTIRGGRMFNFSYLNTYELLASIPSLDDPGRSVRDEIDAFNARIKTDARARLIAGGEAVDVTSMGFSVKDRADLVGMVLRTEHSLGARRIQDCFEPAFLETNFWLMWATMFGFEPWHSAVEFKRYLHRFAHEFHRINTLAGVDRTPLNQYDSIILPIEAWLRARGVTFEMDATVEDLEIRDDEGRSTVEGIRYRQDGAAKETTVGEGDLVFLTNGSMTAASTFGTMAAPAKMDREKPRDWLLWERVARDRRGFGAPHVFDDYPSESYWPSFTVTCRDPAFFDRLESFTGNKPGTGALTTLRDSNWLMSIVVAHQPHFRGQPADVQVFWGYGLYPGRPGNFVDKTMTDCSGAEILAELLAHLRFDDLLPGMLETSTCIPCVMPYVTSQFLVRREGDRPEVVPARATNLAFIGQFCELPEDVVFTVEYSVRAARTAVYTLMGLKMPIPSIYHGLRDPSVIIDAIKTSFA